jgi:hypothetical protein
MFIGSIKRGKSVRGFLRDGFLEPATLFSRHDEIAEEMIRRGYNHKSPLQKIDTSHLPAGRINISRNIEDLRRRCADCADRIKADESR